MAAFEIDFDRRDRLGFPEVVYGASKSVEVLVDILTVHQERGYDVLVTKLQGKKVAQLKQVFPQCITEPEAGIFWLTVEEKKRKAGDIAIVSAGASDAFIVNEVYYTLAYLGLEAERINDVGVSGLHRLMNKIDVLKKFKVIIVVAGFEGALPTVVGGLLPQPIIAVPTSIGYGVASGGQTALNTMLSSCANGITVVNINNGYGAAMAAFRILQL